MYLVRFTKIKYLAIVLLPGELFKKTQKRPVYNKGLPTLQIGKESRNRILQCSFCPVLIFSHSTENYYFFAIMELYNNYRAKKDKTIATNLVICLYLISILANNYLKKL